MKILKTFILLLPLLLLMMACKKESPPQPDPETTINIIKENITVNPSGYNPLSASIELELDKAAKINLTVLGQRGADSDLNHSFSDLNDVHTVPVFGLYAGIDNTVKLSFLNESNTVLGTKVYTIKTEPLIADLPEIKIEVPYTGPKRADFTLVSYFGHNGINVPLRPFMFDQFGDIRWYLNYSEHPRLKHLFYDVGIEKLQNGNYYFANGESDRIYEVDAFGLIVKTWDLPGFEHHHQVYEKPNGNFLVTVSKRGINTVEDHIVEVDRQLNTIINVWDLRQSLDYGRTAMTSNRSDWIHVNAIVFDESDQTIILSGRSQGVVKLTAENEVIWILGNHKGWGNAGNGVDLNTKLLKPLDANDQEIVDPEILIGTKAHPDFDWNWYQHATKLMPNGHILLFDNGEGRYFANELNYSRAVEYAIDKDHRTVKEIWSYGKERGSETYSRIVSDVDFLEDDNRIVFSPGAINNGGKEFGKVVEIDYANKQVLFEATITPPISFFSITFHRTERVKLY
ncbi:MAG: aryl-sulfate sulfotransferase [Saprospiraceae bacterium]